MGSLAVAEDIHPTATPSPHTWKRDQFRAALRAQRRCCKMCQGMPKLHLGEGTEESRQTPGPRAGAILLGKMAHWSLLLRPPATSSSG